MVTAGVLSSMIFYMYYEMHISLPKANLIVNNWIGANGLLALFGGFIADAYLGRYYTICIFSVIYVLVTLQLHPIQSSQ
jgi:peptide/histidine transporter 3/4